MRLGLTALPNAAAAAAGGLPTVDSANAVKIQNGIGANQLDINFGQVKVDRFATGAIDNTAIAADAIGSSEFATSAADEIATSVWAAATRALTDKAGFALSSVESAVVHSGTAQAGAAGSITLAAGASASDDLYRGQRVKIYGGLGAGQSRAITAYNGTTKVATVDRNWFVTPDNTSTYAIESADQAALNSTLQVATSASDPWATDLAPYNTAGTAGNIVKTRVDVAISSRLAPITAGRTLNVDTNGATTLQPPDSEVVQTGTALGSTSTSITLAAAADGTTDIYKGNQIRIVSGPGAGQARTIIASSVQGGNKVATVDRAWIVSPTGSSVYAILGIESPALDANLQPSVGTVGTVTGPVTVGAMNTDSMSAAAISAGAAAKVGGAGWDENIVAGHSSPSSAGLILSQITKRSVNFHSLQAIRDAAATVQLLVNAIWNEPRASHPNVGSFGEGVLVQALNAQAKTDVRGEVRGGLQTDTVPELVQGLPAVTPTIFQLLMLLYMALRNRADSDSAGGFNKIYNDAGTVIAKAAISDAASVFTRAKFQTGP